MRQNPTIRLLIVDDDLLVRTMAAESLKAVGFEVSEAGDGPSGLAQIEKCRPDLLLLDVIMPGMDGYAVCRALRESPRLARIPVIMLTGLDDTESIERAYESGATDFITKPINATLLAYRVRYALRASRMLDDIDRHRNSLANSQRIAHLGSWAWRPASASFECSEEYQRVIGEYPLRADYQWRDILGLVHRDDADHVAQAIDAATGAGEACAVVYRILRRDGAERTVYEQTEVFRDDGGGVMRIEGTTQDITDRVAAEKRIRQLADYDGLTGLANRTLFSEVMQHGLHRSRRQSGNAAVLDINLDRFKRINETLGHALGDRVLQDVGRRIVESIRTSDLVGTHQGEVQTGVFARMGGDGFAVFLSELRHTEDAALIAQRLNEAIAQPMQCAEHELTLTASIGIAIYPDNGEDAGTLLKNAESAMHNAKRRGSGAYCFFTPAMNARALAKMDVESALRGAIERDELLLFYQARVDVQTGRMVGAEALVRWQHPRRGLVPPGEFIQVAEESGLIIPMTAWVLRAACRQLQQWQHAGLPVVPVSINFSARSFREEGLVELIAATLREFGVAPSLLEGEITESMLMQDVERAVTRLQQLRAMGMELSIDDFGTGYSSLAYLKRFPLNAIKIDRAFVKDVLSDTHDAAIASTIITLGKTMGMSVVAEGMECVEQANFLLARGCRLMQGFLFARPVAADAFALLLRDGLVMPPGLRRDDYAAPAAMEPPLLLHSLDHQPVAVGAFSPIVG
jgi:diguanylate cyclase (GGDEF)-like protein